MALLERERDAPGEWAGELPVTNRYTYGLAGERFFRSIMEEARFYGTHCPHCDWTYVPAASFCERCLSELSEWVDAGTSGDLVTFTLLSVESDGALREQPLAVGFIRLGDGGLIHFLGGIEPDQIQIGMKFEAVFKPVTEREGSILDVLYFRPTAKSKIQNERI